MIIWWTCLTCLYNLAEQQHSLSSLARSLMERLRHLLHLDDAAQAGGQLLVDGHGVTKILRLSTSNKQNIKI